MTDRHEQYTPIFTLHVCCIDTNNGVAIVESLDGSIKYNEQVQKPILIAGLQVHHCTGVCFSQYVQITRKYSV